MDKMAKENWDKTARKQTELSNIDKSLTPNMIKSRRILNSMHNRTFFQGVSSCFLNNRCKIKLKTKPKQSSNNKVIDCTKFAKKMLKNCGIIREKHCRAPGILRRGEGKLSCTNGLLYREGSLSFSTNKGNQKSFIFPTIDTDRKSVVQGKSVFACVDLVCRGTIQ